MKTVSTNNLPSRAQCRADDTSGAGFVSVELDATTTDMATYSLHNRGNILHRAIAALFAASRRRHVIRLLRKRAQIRQAILCAWQDIQ